MDVPPVYMCTLMLCCFHSLTGTQSFQSALTASVDCCTDIKTECPFSGVTNSGRVWRMGAGKQGLECACNTVLPPKLLPQANSVRPMIALLMFKTMPNIWKAENSSFSKYPSHLKKIKKLNAYPFL